MTCHVSVITPDGTSVEARALLDNASSASFVYYRRVALFPLSGLSVELLQTHPGQDNLVQVVSLKTAQGTYKRPVSKIAVLLPVD